MTTILPLAPAPRTGPGPRALTRGWASLATGLATAAVAVRVAALTVTGLLLAAVVAPAAAGLHPVVVLTGSMAPAVDPGDVVVHGRPGPEGPRPGQVVVVEDPAQPGALLTHRVVSVAADGTLRTRGDANLLPDSTPVPPEAVLGVGRLLVPAVGRPTVWLRQGRLGPLVGLGVAALAVLSAPAVLARRA